jgi:hypothetical protein
MFIPRGRRMQLAQMKNEIKQALEDGEATVEHGEILWDGKSLMARSTSTRRPDFSDFDPDVLKELEQGILKEFGE